MPGIDPQPHYIPGKFLECPVRRQIACDCGWTSERVKKLPPGGARRHNAPNGAPYCHLCGTLKHWNLFAIRWDCNTCLTHDRNCLCCYCCQWCERGHSTPCALGHNADKLPRKCRIKLTYPATITERRTVENDGFQDYLHGADGSPGGTNAGVLYS